MIFLCLFSCKNPMLDSIILFVILVERHAELCYAECLFMRALLTFIQVTEFRWHNYHFQSTSMTFSVCNKHHDVYVYITIWKLVTATGDRMIQSLQSFLVRWSLHFHLQNCCAICWLVQFLLYNARPVRLTYLNLVKSET